ncbi:MAG: SDR family oxidoreductase [Phycisphaeraceae bacterium]|nr:SDR family oxidoreductase [Phycisphaeraceae bacterium]
MSLPFVIALTQPPAEEAAKAQSVGQLVVLLLSITIVTLVVIVGLLASSLARRRARAFPLPPVKPTARLDPWQEAGKRAATPTASELSGRRAPRESPGLEASELPETGADEAPDGARPVVLITGGAKRVGRAIAAAFAGAGCDVVLTYNNSGHEAHETASMLRRAGAKVLCQQLDLLNIEAVEVFADRVLNTTARLDYLVHNASVYTPTPLADVSAEEADQQFRVHALSPLILSARLAPLLAQSEVPGGGAMVAMLDVHLLGHPRKDFIAYAMSKAALTEMVYCLARELAPRVRVNGVAPGVVAWPENGLDDDPAAREKYLRRIPLGKAGTPEDAAEAVRWLAMSAHYTTGQIIGVDGGRRLT